MLQSPGRDLPRCTAPRAAKPSVARCCFSAAVPGRQLWSKGSCTIGSDDSTQVQIHFKPPCKIQFCIIHGRNRTSHILTLAAHHMRVCQTSAHQIIKPIPPVPQHRLLSSLPFPAGTGGWNLQESYCKQPFAIHIRWVAQVR